MGMPEISKTELKERGLQVISGFELVIIGVE